MATRRGYVPYAGAHINEAHIPRGDDVINAAFEQENLLVNAIDWFSRENHQDEGYNPYASGDVSGVYAAFADNFTDVHSKAAAEEVKARIDRELNNKRLLAEGGFGGFMATMAAGVLSPESLLPLGAALNSAKGAAAVAKTVAVGAGAAGLSEAALQPFQETRTAGESAVAVVGGAILGGVLGGAAQGLKLGERQVMKTMAGSGRDGVIEGQVIDDIANMSDDVLQNEVKFNEAVMQSIEKASGVDTTPDLNKFGQLVAKMLPTPFVRTATSGIAPLREWGDKFYKTSLSKGEEGLNELNRGASVEIKTENWRLKSGVQRSKIFKAFQEYRKTDGNNLTATQFNEELGLAMSSGDVSPNGIAEVTALAKQVRANIVDPLQSDMLNWGLITDTVDEPSYFTRQWSIQGIDSLDARAAAGQKTNGEFSDSFEDVIVRSFMDDGYDLSDATVKAKETIANIKGDSIVKKDGTRGVSPLKGRKVPLTDEQLNRLGVLETNADIILERMVDNLSARLEISKAFRARSGRLPMEYAGKIRKYRAKFNDGHGFNVKEMQDISRDIADMQAARYFSTSKTAAQRAKADKIDELIRERWVLGEDEAVGVRDDLKTLREEANRLSPGTVTEIDGHAYALKSVDELEEGVTPEQNLFNRVEAAVNDIHAGYALDGEDMLVPKKIIDDALEAKREEIIKAGGKSMDKDLAKLKKQQEDIKLDMEFSAMRLRRDSFKGQDPSHFAFRVTSALRKWSFLRLGGGFAISSIPDMANHVFVHGFKTHLKALRHVARNGGFGKVNERLYMQAETVAGGRRSMNISELAEPTNTGVINNTLDAMVNGFDVGQYRAPGFTKLVGLDHWNATMSEFASLEIGHNLIDYSRKLLKGKLGKKKKQDLLDVGIDEPMAKKLIEQFEKHGETDGGLHLPNSFEWKSPAAKRVFEEAVSHGTHRTILRIGVGETPRFFSSSGFSVLAQFKGFAFSSAQQIMLSQLSRREAEALQGLAAAFIWGGVTVALKEVVANQTTPSKILEDENLATFSFNAMDRAGTFGILTDYHNIFQKLSGFGFHAMAGGETQRTKQQAALDVVLGPAFGSVEKAQKVFTDLSSGNIKASTVRSARQLLPYENVAWARGLIDAMQENAIQSFDLPGANQ